MRERAPPLAGQRIASETPAARALLRPFIAVALESHRRQACVAERTVCHWLCAVPSSMLPKKALKALGHKDRRKSMPAELLELMTDKVLLVPGTPVTTSSASAAPSNAVVVDAESLTELPELLAVVPTAGS